MRLKILILTIVSLFNCAAFAQTDSLLKQVKVIGDSTIDFTVDNLGNIFLLNNTQQVKKLDGNYDSVGVFNDIRRYGKLFSIDASNPLKLLLFYKDFNTIVVLDRFLNIRNTIDLRQSGIFQVSAIATSYDNNIWLFDELDNKIKKMDDNGKIILESPDFRMIYDIPPRPTQLADYNRYVYAYDSSRGLLVMDYFGACKNLLAFKGWNNMQTIAKGIVATDGTGLVYYQPGTLNTEQHLLIPEVLHAKKIKVSGTKLYALQQDGNLHIYQLQQ